MVANLTPWLSLTKPQVNGPETENQWGYDLNVNFDVLDSAVGPALSHLDAVQVDLDAIYDALDTKAPIASPALTGNPTAPTPPAGDADNSIATTAFVKDALTAQGAIFPSNAAPVMDGTAAPGTSVLYSREDHKHPIDTSRAPLNSPDFQGSPTSPTPAVGTNSDILATTKFVKDQGYVTAAYVDAKPAGTTISDTPPANPTQGQTWWESDTGKYFINYYDGDTTQWVHINGPLANVYAKNETYSRTEADTKFVDVAGDTMTGALVLAGAPSSALIMNKPATAGASNNLVGQLNGVNRWSLQFGSGDAEAGGNVGSAFILNRFSDTGVFLDQPLNISRADGRVALASTIASNSPTTGALTVAGGVGVKGLVSVASLTAGSSVNLGGLGGAGHCLEAFVNNGIASFSSYDRTAAAAKPMDWYASSYNFQGAAANVTISSNTASSSSTTGALVVGGGVGIGGLLCVGSGTPLAFNCRTQIVYSGGATQYGMGFRPAADTTTVMLFGNAAGTPIGSISQTAAATAYNTTSSAELKEDLQSFDAGNIIDDTEVYDFKWKGLDERAYGVIAQQAAEVYPLAVTHTETEEEDWWGVDYSKYVPVILQELKALRARVAELEGEKAPVAPKKRGH
jgi:hypothetical protein